jgi:heat shock protein HslJ
MGMRPIAIALATAVLMSGCTAAGPADVTRGPQLSGRTFLSTGVILNGAPMALVDGTQIRIRFDDRTVSVDAGCNNMSGPYTVDGSTLVVESLAMTDMACQPPIRMDQDTWLAQILSGRPTVELTGDELRLTGSGVRITLLDREVAEPDRTLVGPRWVVETTIDGDLALSIADGSKAYLSFDAGGRVTGETGCNAIAGSYSADPDTITFSLTMVTAVLCSGVRGTLDRNVTVLFEGRPIAYRIDGDQLTLTYADRSGGLVLRAR